MRQSALIQTANSLHAAIIMDGNGRWATSRGLPRVAGHREGAKAVRRTVETAPKLGITTLTLYAFSQDNWQRPKAEVQALMRLFRSYLLSETDECIENGIRVEVIGRRDRFEPGLLAAIGSAEQRTSACRTLHLRIAVDYSSKYSLMRAAEMVSPSTHLTEQEFARLVARANNSANTPDVDFLIRTGGEQRLSDFLLWEAAYAELIFTPRMWPDFDATDLEEAVAQFHSRQRRFGGVPEAATG
ncbi:MAG TPA: di-trans,poly-cis-decaprenylcistransferase [Blastocatellia bacterium]|nr:di-trans,poly-cis-decaprenylcistransferase [Blastocatellia bacterium]